MKDNAKSRKAQQKRNYEEMRDIERRINAGQPTEYMERQRYYIWADRLKAKK
jgi:hypothetical protein